MNKAKHVLRSKFSFVTILSLGSLVLGIVCICWALINIGAQSVHSADAYSNPSSTPTTFAVNQVRLTGDDAAPTESGDATDILNPDKILYPLYPSEGDN